MLFPISMALMNTPGFFKNRLMTLNKKGCLVRFSSSNNLLTDKKAISHPEKNAERRSNKSII